MPSEKTTAEHIDLIVAELGGKVINDPRTLANRSGPLDRYARAEVRREIDRLRSRQSVLQFDMPTIAEIRQAMETLERLRLLPPTVVAGVQRISRETPERSNELKYRSAAGAWHLMKRFSKEEPTSSQDGPFHVIAQRLYSAATGELDETVKSACDWILQQRRRYAPIPLKRA